MNENADHSVVYPVLERSAKGAHLEGEAAYEKLYKQSIEEPKTFWKEQAETLLHWVSFLAIEQFNTSIYIGENMM